MNVGAATKLS